MRKYKLKKCKRVQSLHFTPAGGQVLAVGGAEVRTVDTAVWLDIGSGNNVDRINQFAPCYAVSPDLSRLVLGGADVPNGVGSIHWTALPKGDGWHPFPDPTRGKSAVPTFKVISGLAFDQTGGQLAVTHPSRRRKGIEVGWGFELAVVRFDPPELVNVIPIVSYAGVISFDETGDWVAVTGGLDGHPAVYVFDIPTGTLVYQYDPPATVSRCLLFLPDGRLVVANGRNVYALPPDRPEPLFVLGGHQGQVNAVALTRDGSRLLTASHDGLIRVWDAATGKQGPSFDWQVGPVTAVAFAPDGLTCAAAGLNGKVVVWDVDG